MLSFKNIRKLAQFSSYLYLVAILCLKALVPLSHSHEAQHTSNEKGFHAASFEHCFACEVEHAASLFTLDAVIAFVFATAFLGMLLLFPFILKGSTPFLFSFLRGPPVCTVFS